MRRIFQHAVAPLFVSAALALFAAGAAAAQVVRPSRAVPGQIVLKAPAGMSETEVRSLADAAGCRVAGPIAYSPGFYLLETKTRSAAATRSGTFAGATPAVREAVARLTSVPGVIANPNWVKSFFQGTGGETSVSPNDPRYATQWNLRMIRMPEAWAIQKGVKPVLVAVLDSGFDVGHPDFEDEKGQRIYVASKLRNFADPTNPGTDVTDTFGHGVHVAGTIAALTNNGRGVASIAGWRRGGVNLELLPVKLGDDPTAASSVAAINYALAQGANVANLSYGSSEEDPAESAAIANAIAKGMVIVAAAGNENTQAPIYPGDVFGVIKVSAVGPDRTRASYSNYGGAIAIAAPGGDTDDGPEETSAILSTYGRNLDASGYRHLEGTSMAAPHVTGVVALLFAAGAAPGQIRDAIQSTAMPLNEPPNPAGGNQYGAGLIDAYAALRLFTQLNVDIVGPQDRGTTLLKNVTIQLTVRQAAQLSAPSDLTVEIRTATLPSTVVRTLIGGQDFTVPPADPTRPNVPVTVTIPNVVLPDGRYVIDAKLRGVSQDIQFITVASQVQPAGRSLFSIPFRLQPAAGTGPETSLFGAGVSFTLHRWDPLRNQTGDYVRWSSLGEQEEPSILRPGFVNGVPLVYDVTRPNVFGLGDPNYIAPVGLGFWLNLGNNQVLNLTGEPVNNPVAIRLFAAGGGWNLIGAPFTFPVDWNAATVFQGGTTYTLQQAIDRRIVRSALVGYAGGDYVFQIAPAGRLVPFNGYWVNALQDCILVIPPVPSAVQTDGSRALPSVTAGEGWRARLVASVAGDRDGQNYFGQIAGAEAGEDRFDVAKPPSGAGHAYVRFLSQDSSDRRSLPYAFDMRPGGASAARQEWTAAVTTDRENAPVTLSWEGLGAIPRRSRLTLTDVATGKTLSLRDRSSFTYRSGAAGATRLFKITLEPAATAGRLALANLHVASGRALQGVAVRFTVNQDADVRGVIRTLGGKVIATLAGASRAAPASEATLRWDGRAQNGGPVPVGPYLVEITARAADGQFTQVKRPIQYLR